MLVYPIVGSRESSRAIRRCPVGVSWDAQDATSASRGNMWDFPCDSVGFHAISRNARRCSVFSRGIPRARTSSFVFSHGGNPRAARCYPACSAGISRVPKHRLPRGLTWHPNIGLTAWFPNIGLTASPVGLPAGKMLSNPRNYHGSSHGIPRHPLGSLENSRRASTLV